MEKKQSIKFKTVEEYLSTLPENTKGLLLTLRDLIKKEVPKAEEGISYNIPAFKVNGAWLVYFAAWTEHISLYPIPAGDEAFQKQISTYKGGKGTIKFPIDKPLPLPLIKKIVKFSLKENLEKTKTKKEVLEQKKKTKTKKAKT